MNIQAATHEALGITPVGETVMLNGVDLVKLAERVDAEIAYHMALGVVEEANVSVSEGNKTPSLTWI